jgi:hypothetical protein
MNGFFVYTIPYYAVSFDFMPDRSDKADVATS